jgi:hypothetical protein
MIFKETFIKLKIHLLNHWSTKLRTNMIKEGRVSGK